MKGNEAPQTKNQENQRPQAQKSENRLGYGADKFFVWDLGKTNRFWQLVGGGPRGRPPQEEMLFNMDHAHGGPPCKEQILMCHKKKRYQTWTTARLKDAPPEGSKGHKEPKDTPPEGPKGQKDHRIPPLKAQNAKSKAPKAKMEAEKLK